MAFVSSLPESRVARKALGAWYTPRTIARLLVRWAVRWEDAHVLDPAAGDGIFLEEAAHLLSKVQGAKRGHQLHGVDINPEAISASRTVVADILGSADHADLRLVDFFRVEPPDSLLADLQFVDAVVGNPPYVRYQAFGKQTRGMATLRASNVGVRLSNLCSAWAPFVVHAVSFLRPGGRLALVLPEELLYASYAVAVRDYVRRSFKRTIVVHFEGNIFPQAQERVVFLLGDGKGGEPSGELRLARALGLEDVGNLEELIGRSEVHAPHSEPRKWEPGFDDDGTVILDRLVSEEYLVPLRTIGKAGIGYVTGANKYFVLSASQVATLSFPKRVLKATVIGAKQVPGAFFSRSDLGSLVEDDARCLLWTGRGTHLPQIARYIEEGERKGIDKRYKCRVRDPWYVVPGVVHPDAFLTYMSDEIPRLIINDAGACCSNTLLAVELSGVSPKRREPFALSFYNSATMLAAERIGRRYGGGVLKLEPSEADRLLVPNPLTLSKGRQSRRLLEQLDTLLREGKVEDILRKVDAMFLGGICGLSGDEISRISTSHTRRRHRRKSRPRPQFQ